MIETVFSLCCDQCMEPFRTEDSYEFDLALESHADVRKLARAAGWKRMNGRAGKVDLCPPCQAEFKPTAVQHE